MDDKVRIYTYTDVKGPRRRAGHYAYLLEADTGKGPATLHKVERVEGPETENRVQLMAALAALRRLKRNCELTICTHSPYLAAAFERGWIAEWERNGWKNGKGEPVANMGEWQEMAELLNAHEFSFEVGKHEYSEWMEHEIRKEKGHV